jgi:hypothetical protein
LRNSDEKEISVMTTSAVKIIRVVPDSDLRKVHAYRRRVGHLRNGEAVLYVNRAGDKARIVDAAKAVHNYYAPAGAQFDLRMIQSMVKAMRLTLLINVSDSQKAFGSEDLGSKAA